MARITPFTDAAKSLAEAAFGNPGLRQENEKFLSEQELRGARTGAAQASAEASRASAASSAATAAKTRAALSALNSLSPEMFQLDAQVEVPAQTLAPNVFGPGAPASSRDPNPEEISSRGSELASILARSGNLNAGNLGDFRSTLEGALANVGVVDTDTRLRNAAAGAGSPFSETQAKAQVFANLPQATQNVVAGAVPSDQVFGGALATQRTPEQLAVLGETKAQPSSIAEFLFSQQNPGFANFAKSTSGGTNIQIGPDGSVSQASPLTKTNITSSQRDVAGRRQAARLAGNLIINSNTVGAIPAALDIPAVGIANQLIPGAVGKALDVLPGERDFDQLKTDRATNKKIVQQIRTQLINEDGKLSDKDQALVDELGTALRGDLTAEQARTIIQRTIDSFNEEADSAATLLREGVDISAPGQGADVQNIDVDSMTLEELNALEAELDAQIGVP